MNRVAIAVLIVTQFLVACAARADGTITLRSIVRLEPSAPLTLAAVAALEGPEAEALAGLAIEAKGDSVSIEQVREAIEAGQNVNWGRLALAGSRCRVVRLAEPEPAPEAPPVELIERGRGEVSEGTVGALVPSRVAASLGIEPARLKLDFGAPGPDGSILEVPSAGHTVEIRPVGVSDRLPIAITVYDHDRIVAKGIVRAEASVLRDIAVAAAPIGRGDSIGTLNMQREARWLPFSARALTPEEASGRVARSRIGAGDAISAQDAAPPIVIGKGHHAIIHCISGSIVLKLRARAMSDGAPGDTIEFTGLDGKKGRLIRARVEAPGIAIATTDEALSISP